MDFWTSRPLSAGGQFSFTEAVNTSTRTLEAAMTGQIFFRRGILYKGNNLFVSSFLLLFSSVFFTEDVFDFWTCKTWLMLTREQSKC